MDDTLTVFDLKEVEPAHIRAAEKAILGSNLKIVAREAIGVFKIITVKSGENTYQVRRFLNFCACSCNGFTYGKICKHIAFTFAPICPKCESNSVARISDTCIKCEIKNVPYLKPSLGGKTTRIGNIRI